MKKKTIAIGADHAGYEYKEIIKKRLDHAGYTILDMGTDSTNSVDYPDFVHPVAEAIEKEEASLGIIICGSGNGVAMTANKHQGIRAALCWNENLAELARQHNDANVLAIPARFISENMALDMTELFLKTDFEGGRHARRVGKISMC